LSRMVVVRVVEIPSNVFGVFALRAISIVARKGKIVVDDISTTIWRTQKYRELFTNESGTTPTTSVALTKQKLWLAVGFAGVLVTMMMASGLSLRQSDWNGNAVS
jgi:hypothetical protein